MPELWLSPAILTYLGQSDNLFFRALDTIIGQLQIVHKINTELAYARLDLQKALKGGGDVNRARKRVGWLEDRMENLLGKKRVRVSFDTQPDFGRTFYEL